MIDFSKLLGVSPYVGNWIAALVSANLLLVFVAVSAIFFIWLERKVAGRIQDRLGPTRVGGKFGWLQTIADGIKLLVKEDLIPADADQMLFRLGPYIAFCGSFLAFIALPFANGVVAMTLNIGVFFMLAVMSTEVFGIILAGYGSGSKWSLFGGMREAAQMVSYEVPMAICVLVPVIVAGTHEPRSTSASSRPAASGTGTSSTTRSPSSPSGPTSPAPRPAASGPRSTWPRPRANWSPASTPNTAACAGRSSSWPSTAACSPSAASPSLLFLGGWNTGLLPLST